VCFRLQIQCKIKLSWAKKGVRDFIPVRNIDYYDNTCPKRSWVFLKKDFQVKVGLPRYDLMPLSCKYDLILCLTWTVVIQSYDRASKYQNQKEKSRLLKILTYFPWYLSQEYILAIGISNVSVNLDLQQSLLFSSIIPLILFVSCSEQFLMSWMAIYPSHWEKGYTPGSSTYCSLG
jgi:hypothetical protein